MPKTYKIGSLVHVSEDGSSPTTADCITFMEFAEVSFDAPVHPPGNCAVSMVKCDSEDDSLRLVGVVHDLMYKGARGLFLADLDRDDFHFLTTTPDVTVRAHKYQVVGDSEAAIRNIFDQFNDEEELE